MRILYVAQNYVPEMGANPGRIAEMSRAWVAAGHEVEVLAPVPNHPSGVVPPEYRGFRAFREIDDDGVEATRTWIYAAANKGRIRRSMAYASFGLASFVLGSTSKRRPDIVIGSSPQPLAAASAMGIAKMHGIPWIFEVRDLWPESVVAVGAMRENNPFVRAIAGLTTAMYESATRVVAVTRSIEDVLARRGVPRDKLALVPNGVDLGRFYPRPPDSTMRARLAGGARFLVTYAGTIGMAHDLGRFLDVAERMKGRDDVAFALVGDGAEREALETAARERTLTNVRFAGAVARERMPDVYAASDLLVVTLRAAEVFKTVLPSKMFEIMAMAKPILLAVDGEARAVLEEAGAGSFVPPGDTDALHEAVATMIADAEGRAEQGARGRDYVAKTFDRKMLARKYLEVLMAACR